MHFHASFRECNSSIRGSPRGATLQDLLANGARHVVVPRYVQTERATQLAEFAVVFRLGGQGGSSRDMDPDGKVGWVISLDFYRETRRHLA